MSEPTPFETLGGEPVLRTIVDRFVDRVFDDPMIGFFFKDADRQRIKDKEYEHAAQKLGADVTYTGRPIAEAHQKHPITGGHFLRRLRLLDETLRQCGVPDSVRELWLAENERLRPAITRDSGSECDHDAANQDAKKV